MSDSLRQSNTDKATSTLKPDSQKSGLEQAGDSVKSTADSVAGKAQPDSEKSTGQSVTDSVSGGSKDASSEGKSVVDQASEGLSNAAGQAQNALGMGSTYRFYQYTYTYADRRPSREIETSMLPNA
ncbi:hypothetical protein LTR27_012279 [Elasticomyces elasticus]|nr:hypothetical protein LTR27_012279 [Elasticomyces elasticus]